MQNCGNTQAGRSLSASASAGEKKRARELGIPRSKMHSQKRRSEEASTGAFFTFVLSLLTLQNQTIQDLVHFLR